MFNVSPVPQPFGDPVPAGRATEIVRGAQRMLAELGLASLTEVTLANGRRADVMAVDPKGQIVILEVKSCLQDFAADQKWPEYAPYCDRFYFPLLQGLHDNLAQPLREPLSRCYGGWNRDLLPVGAE